MSFADDVARFSVKVQTRSKDVFVRVVELATESIVEGSAITAAPGQPVDTGALKASWQTVFDTPTSALIATNVVYAEPIENGVGRFGPLTLRSSVGGFHSVKLTIAGFPRLLAAAVAEVAK